MSDDAPLLPPPESESLPQVLVAAVRRAPHTGYALARHLDRLWPGFLKEREGSIYPVLLELWRDGEIDSSWEDLPQGRRRVYRIAGQEAGTGVAVEGRRAGPLVGGVPPARWSEPVEKAAASATSSLAFAPRLEEELRAELVGHLEDSVAAYRDLAQRSPVAEQKAVRDLGDPWRIRTDLRRAAQGKRTVIFPQTWLEGLYGIAIYDLRILLVIMATILFVRVQVVTAYHIPTRSMEPTLHGDPDDGDRILVNKWSGEVERFDITVFDGWHSERKNFVKRAVGLPNEKVELFGGDLWVDGELFRKDGSAYEALLFPLFVLEDHVALAQREDPDSWKDELSDQLKHEFKSETGKWSLTVGASGDEASVGFSAETEAGETAILRFDQTPKDGVYDRADAESGGGREYVSDLRAEVRLTALVPGTRAGVRLGRGDRTVEALLATGGTGVELLVDGNRVHFDPGYPLEVGRPVVVRLARVDHVVRLEVDGKLLVRHDLPAPAFPSHMTPRGQITFTVERGEINLTPLRLERDIHWTSGDYDETTSIQLGEDEYFMLGDNSGNSQDSRSRGPVHGSRIVGRPLLVVWPPARALIVPR